MFLECSNKRSIYCHFFSIQHRDIENDLNMDSISLQCCFKLKQQGILFYDEFLPVGACKFNKADF